MARHRCARTGKVKYATRRHAGMMQNTAMEARGHETRAYRCEFCNAWHLTSQPRDRHFDGVPGANDPATSADPSRRSRRRVRAGSDDPGLTDPSREGDTP